MARNVYQLRGTEVVLRCRRTSLPSRVTLRHLVFG